MNRLYHSAHLEEVDTERKLLSIKKDGCSIFRHDITKFIPECYKKCDVIYIDTSWNIGYKHFMERAGEEKSSYSGYLKALASVVLIGKPTWIITGKHAKKKLPVASRKLEIKLNGRHDGILLGWNDDNDYSFSGDGDFLNQIANVYSHVGDPCCGYGNTGEAFKNHGKLFTMSDINSKCVYISAKRLLDYEC